MKSFILYEAQTDLPRKADERIRILENGNHGLDFGGNHFDVTIYRSQISIALGDTLNPDDLMVMLDENWRSAAQLQAQGLSAVTLQAREGSVALLFPRDESTRFRAIHFEKE